MGVFGKKKLKAPDFTAGRTEPVALPRGGLLAGMLLALDYDFVNAGTTTGTVHAEGGYRASDNLRVVGTNRRTRENVAFVDVVPRDLHTLFALLKPRQRPQTDPVASGIGATEAGRRIEIEIPMYGLGLNEPERFGLPLGLVDGAELRVGWGNAADLVDGETGTAPAFNNEVVDLLGLTFPGPRQLRSPLITVTERYIVEADETDRRLELPRLRPGWELVRVLVKSEVDDVVSDAVIAELGLVIDNDSKFDKLARGVYQRDNVERYNLTAIQTGAVLFDFADDGNSEVGDLETIRTNERPYVLADVVRQTGSNRIRIVAQYVRRFS